MNSTPRGSSLRRGRRESLTGKLARRLREEAPTWRWEVSMDADGEAVAVKKIRTGKPPLPHRIGLPKPPEPYGDDFWSNWYADFKRRGGMEGAIERYCAAGKVVEEREEGWRWARGSGVRDA